jgi:hypothetical protein
MAENDTKKDDTEAEAASAPAPEAQPEARPRTGRGGTFVLGALVVVALVGAAAALVAFEPRLSTQARAWFDADAARARAALDERVNKLGRRVDTLEGRFAGLPAPIDAGRIKALEARLAAMAPGVGAERIAELENRLKALEAHRASAPQATKGATVPPGALVLAALARRLDLGRPFADLSAKGNSVLGALGAGAARDVLAALAPYADKGVPTAAALARVAAGLTAPAPAAKEASAPSPAPGPSADGWWASIRARIAGLVTIRRIGENTAAPAPAAPATGGTDITGPAVAAFAAGDVAAARAALAGIAPAALAPADAAQLARLIADTDARLRADHLSTALDAALAALP